jgi:hypothetical protein
MSDPLLQLLAGLPSAALDPSRADRVRARCHDALGRRRRHVSNPTPPGRIWTSLVAGMGGLYITAVLHEVLALYGFL